MLFGIEKNIVHVVKIIFPFKIPVIHYILLHRHAINQKCEICQTLGAWSYMSMYTMPNGIIMFSTGCLRSLIENKKLLIRNISM